MTPKDITTHDAHDVRQGVDWWRGLTPEAREHWMERAGSVIPADAWRLYKKQLLEGRGHE